MKKLKTIFHVLLVFALVSPTSIVFASTMWNQTYGGVWGEVAYSLVESSDGGYAIAGYTQSFGDGESDFWLVKSDANGNVDWSQTYGGKNSDRAYSLVETSDGGYALAGVTDSFGAGGYDFWLIKTDLYGNLEWSKTFGGSSSETAYSLVETSDGGYAIVGETFSFGAGELDFWLVKIDSQGNMEWNRTYGGTGDESAYGLIETSDGGYALTGYVSSFDAIGGRDCWLIKTDKFGNVQWNQTYGGAGFDVAYSLIESSDGGYALAGNTGSLFPHFWLIKTDHNGTMEWYETYAGDVAYSLVETSDGGFAIAGYIEPHREGKHIRLVKTDAQGNEVWNQTYGETNQDVAYSLVESSSGGYALAGFISYSSFDSEAGWLDFWLIKTNEYSDVPEFSSWTLLFFMLVSVAGLCVIFKNTIRRQNKKGGI